jgi:uncharacterized protein (TIGR02145 family)
MLAVAIYIKDVQTGLFNRVDLFDDEKISVVSSIQNINDISKTFTDFSQTFTVPASKQNNKIFRHWYDNSNDEPFSTLVKADAYIEIDTITFRKGKIQLESANVEDGQAKDYSITFIGLLGNLKDTFAGLYLKDLTSTTYDFNYTPDEVLSKVTGDGPSEDVMFPLISSKRLWGYGDGNGATNNIANEDYPIRYNELFPALRLRAVFNMIEERFGINFDGTTAEPSTFLTDPRFLNAYLWLKNAEEFKFISTDVLFTFQTTTGFPPTEPNATYKWQNANTSLSTFTSSPNAVGVITKEIILDLYPNVAGVNYQINLWSNTSNSIITTINTTSTTGLQSFKLMDTPLYNYTGETHSIRIICFSNITFSSSSQIKLVSKGAGLNIIQYLNKTSSQSITPGNLSIKNYMPEIKIEDFFSGILKMFNLTCYSTDGINYTLEQLESYYGAGSDVDITKYVIQDKKTLNRVKTHKKINFDYEKSDSVINVGFESINGIPYGSLRYSNSPPAEGEEYSVKLPFEDLNFNNLNALLQVGYVLKTDYSNYIPKPIILYDYNSANATTAPEFYWSNSLTGNGAPYTTYKAFGQETLIGTETYGLNFNEQQSTLTNEIVQNGLYQTYYSNYFANIFDFKARLTKISAILPTSILTSLKLNDTILIRDTKYLINTMTTDLTSGVAQFELLTDQRIVELATEVLIGTQLWTNRNLDVETYRDGTPIPQVTDPTAWAALTTGAWCYYANNTANGVVYGKLYNWYAVAGIHDTDPSTPNKILAPLGYHVPTDAEWTTLTTYLGTNAGGKMKSTASLWTNPNTDATNESGFTGLPGGSRDNSGPFYSIGGNGRWWSLSGYDTALAWCRRLNYNAGDASRLSASKKDGFSVRLIKD